MLLQYMDVIYSIDIVDKPLRCVYTRWSTVDEVYSSLRRKIRGLGQEHLIVKIVLR